MFIDGRNSLSSTSMTNQMSTPVSKSKTQPRSEEVQSVNTTNNYLNNSSTSFISNDSVIECKDNINNIA